MGEQRPGGRKKRSIQETKPRKERKGEEYSTNKTPDVKYKIGLFSEVYIEN